MEQIDLMPKNKFSVFIPTHFIILVSCYPHGENELKPWRISNKLLENWLDQDNWKANVNKIVKLEENLIAVFYYDSTITLYKGTLY
jgi:hypothetical protein